MKLLALVLLLAAFSSPILTEVVGSFQQSCPNFFIRNPANQNQIIVPTVFSGRQYQKICQRLENNYRFATVYDTVRRIPVYSAYTFIKFVNTERFDWKIEPQLEDIPEYKDIRYMIDSPTDPGDIWNQAVDSDYVGSGYTRGHVFPNSYAADQDQANSTFTLTNIAPQTQNDNGQWERQVEQQMLRHLRDDCRLDQNHPAYIVTGVVPGNQWLPITRNNDSDPNGINIPSHYWSAFCCTNKKNIKERESKAYIAEMGTFSVREPSLDKLNSRLTSLYGQSFSVFPGLHC
ncbi:endonuclease domain-containing 1 protein-like [Neoarius graeffei]|uniref:endonuclease domain-containing 1 protein-like n=1 Tax=Neoarius graeffei TaxID=443677 RepID=UPI00298BCEBD|nr:endonuclease domain-containing 1 protein-like [Neoarius graeffei]XP_060774612.1 endonuclease domain-containing 1 protein-like [Neoarius graeffei]